MNIDEAETLLAHEQSLGEMGVTIDTFADDLIERVAGRVLLDVAFDPERFVVTLLFGDREDDPQGHAIAFAIVREATAH